MDNLKLVATMTMLGVVLFLSACGNKGDLKLSAENPPAEIKTSK